MRVTSQPYSSQSPLSRALRAGRALFPRQKQRVPEARARIGDPWEMDRRPYMGTGMGSGLGSVENSYRRPPTGSSTASANAMA